MDFTSYDIALINAVPFIIAALLALPVVRTLVPKDAQTWLAGGAMAALFVALLGYFPAVQAEGVVERSIPWVPALGMTLSFYLDGLSLLFALVVTGVGALIFLYSGYYFEDAAEQSRFNMWLAAFAGAMLGLVLSGNIITMFIMWELTSITSFMLIGFKGEKYESARFGAMQALLVTGGGGLALLGGVVLLGAAGGMLHTMEEGWAFLPEFSQLLQLDPAAVAAHPWYIGFAVLLMLGAFTKSAQFPFHFWLPGAMEAPTPASSFLHSATMVKAGVYLLLRLYPIMSENPFWTSTLLSVGLVTLFLASFLSIRQRDLKGLLAYSTVAQLGAFVALIGLPNSDGLKAALVGILAHALYKAALFLIVGTVDHSTGTRVIDKLGGLRRQMPVMAIITVISGLSMAGVPFFFGFVAKEVLLDAMYLYSNPLPLILTIGGALFTTTAALIIIWDVFFRPPKEEVHFHAAPSLINLGPGVLAFGSLTFGFLLDPLIIPLVQTGVPKTFKLLLFPGFTEVFFISLGAITAGFVVFLLRDVWLKWPWPSHPQGTLIYQSFIRSIEWVGDMTVRSQNGRLRYYLVVILGVVSIVLIGSGLVTDLTRGQQISADLLVLRPTDNLNLMLITLAIIGATASIVFKRHLWAVLSVGVMGYAVGGIFLIEQAPDVALVQFLVETLATVLVIVMLGRISKTQREAVMKRLWTGRSGYGVLRDILIATAVGGTVAIFAVTAVVNRPSRETIAQWHLDNAYTEVAVPDVVAAILTDFRGTDTLLEIFVFAAAAIGVLTLLARGRERTTTFIPDNLKTHEELRAVSLNEGIQNATSLSTPLTRAVAAVTLPIALMISFIHVLYGAQSPGDGFTAGVVSGLAIALWYVVFGYEETRSRLGWFRPTRILRTGLVIAVGNALLPLLVGREFFAYTDIIAQAPAGLHIASSLFFEVGIALTVFGSVGTIMEAIAHPAKVDDVAH